MICVRLISFICVSVSVAMGQTTSGALQVLQLPEEAKVRFLEETIRLGFPEDHGDRAAVLASHESKITVALLEGAVRRHFVGEQVGLRLEACMELIAYAGDENAFRAISGLTKQRPELARYFNRTLQNARTVEDSFDLAYKGMAIGDPVLSREILNWTERMSSFPRRQAAWAEVFSRRFETRQVDDALITDPIAVKMARGDHARLKRLKALVFEAHLRRSR
jgi:hypothetical protein